MHLSLPLFSVNSRCSHVLRSVHMLFSLSTDLFPFSFALRPSRDWWLSQLGEIYPSRLCMYFPSASLIFYPYSYSYSYPISYFCCFFYIIVISIIMSIIIIVTVTFLIILFLLLLSFIIIIIIIVIIITTITIILNITIIVLAVEEDVVIVVGKAVVIVIVPLSLPVHRYICYVFTNPLYKHIHSVPSTHKKWKKETHTYRYAV